LTRPAGGLAGDVIRFINQSGAIIISVDIPSGLFGEDNSGNDYDTVVSAGFTLSFQFLSCLLCFLKMQGDLENGSYFRSVSARMQ